MASTTKQTGPGRPRSAQLSQWGRTLEAMAARRGMDRGELAARANLTPGGLWSVLTGRTQPSLATAMKLAHALGVPVGRLMAAGGRPAGEPAKRPARRRRPA